MFKALISSSGEIREGFIIARAITLTLLGIVAAACSPLPVSDSAVQLNQQLMAGIDNCIAGNKTLALEVGKQRELIELQSSQLETIAGAQRASIAKNSDSVEGESGCSAGADALPRKQVVGQLEEIWMPNLNLALNGRIDTGAETASLDARNIELFERDGKRWVRFEIEHPEAGNPPLKLERKLSRIVSIVQSNSPEAERRPVIKLGVTIGSVNQIAEFTLSNRSHLDYQVLIGRNILQDVMVVDVSQKNIAPYVKSDTEVASTGGK